MENIIQTFCEKYGITEDQFYGREPVGGYLDLESVTSLPEGFNPTVGGSLYLESVTSLPEGFNPTVGGSLYLGSVTSLPEGFNPAVGGYLNLGSVTSLPEGFNPAVGDSLYLESVTSLPEGFNPTVGGSLYLRSVTSLPEGFNPAVGGDLYLGSGLTAPVKKPTKPINNLLFWRDGKYVLADGVFTEVIEKKGNVYRVKQLNSEKEFYLVTDGTFCAHGYTKEQAKEDLRFKVAAEKLKNDPITADTVIDIRYYRIITGACEIGVKMWMQENGITKQSYKASELLPILEKTNAYGLDRFKKLVAF